MAEAPDLEYLISTFNEFNCPTVDELHSEPTPLEFMRYVSRNCPFIIRGGASSWRAVQKWNTSYLKRTMEGKSVNVAVTPFGNADAPTYSTDNDSLVLAKPLEETHKFDEFLDYIIEQERQGCRDKTTEVRYAQTQNDNLRDEYSALLSDAKNDIPFARIALQTPPEAVNLWIGNSHSVTATHKDNFENIFVQIRGRKHFVLLPPICLPCMNEQDLTSTTYVRSKEGLVLCEDKDAPKVPFVTWDPDKQENATKFSHLAQPIRVTLYPGDILYLPAMWYHKVAQSVEADDPDPFIVAINYWYDMEFTGPHYPFTLFLQKLCSMTTQE